ncbi:MAG: acetyltransferase [Patescibacteria group bacterium]|nr:acetyltransferase [Patescibacteria group bacterium]MDD5121303.1 acetyltransferase [Patescibacteria group bacterium]MDD5221733.1 acetyltransferase [Patescibacteria group bacterium]MDD5395778.1 acetyltransferase [Patescibacteria group bacterium]
MSKSIIIYGTGGHAKVVADIIRLRGEYHIVGFVDDCDEKSTFLDQPVYQGIKQIPKNVKTAFVAIGDNKIRRDKAKLLRELGFSLPILIHPGTIISKLQTNIQSGTLVAAGAIINPGVIIGEDCIINTGASLDHDDIVGYAVHIAPQACLCGGVKVGDFSFVGANSCIRQYCNVGVCCTIGMGAAVIRDIPDNSMVMGVPAHAK